MPDYFYPKVSIEFINSTLEKINPDVFGTKISVGSTTVYTKPGKQALYKRITLVREIDPGNISFEQATALAIRFGFMTQLLEWLLENKNWKDGGYIESLN